MVGPILWGVRPDFQSPFDSGKHFLGSPSAKICSDLGGFENFGGPRLIWLASLITLVIDIGSTNPLKSCVAKVTSAPVSSMAGSMLVG